ncbi:MAG: hypothetical protein JWR55_1014 [Aeromicrobium sp.]|jgi:hypothetical protein|nr:hypothetical protein [Aeromicrobium sp.]
MTDTWEDNLWTDTTRSAYLTAGEAAIETLRSHLAVVASASSDADEPAIDESAESVRQAFIAVSDAQFEYSATVAPFSLLDDEDADAPDEDEEPLDTDAEHNQISIMLRRDFRLTSGAALIEAGRVAATTISPEDALDATTEDVDDLGRALYQIVHAGGIDALNDVAGLDPVVGVILAVGRDDLLTEEDLDELMDDPGELFAGEGEIIYSQADVWS